MDLSAEVKKVFQQHLMVRYGSELAEAIEREERPGPPIGVPLLEALQGWGLSRGVLIELSGGRSSGLTSVCLAALAAVTSAGESAAWIDPGDHLDPQRAGLFGVDLSRLLWVRPNDLKGALASAETILSAGFSLVVLDLAEKVPWLRPPDAAWIRLARAAKAQGSLLLIRNPVPLPGPFADASVTAARVRPVWLGEGRAPKVLAGFSADLTLRKRKGARREVSETFLIPVEGSVQIHENKTDRLPLGA
jgi:hypothetical protein